MLFVYNTKSYTNIQQISIESTNIHDWFFVARIFVLNFCPVITLIWIMTALFRGDIRDFFRYFRLFPWSFRDSFWFVLLTKDDFHVISGVKKNARGLCCRLEISHIRQILFIGYLPRVNMDKSWWNSLFPTQLFFSSAFQFFVSLILSFYNISLYNIFNWFKQHKFIINFQFTIYTILHNKSICTEMEGIQHTLLWDSRV